MSSKKRKSYHNGNGGKRPGVHKTAGKYAKGSKSERYVVRAGARSGPQKLYFDSYIESAPGSPIALVAGGNGVAPVLDSAVIISGPAGQSGRGGNTIRILNVNLHARLGLRSSTAVTTDGTATGNRVRVVVYYDTQTSQKSFGSSTLWQNLFHVRGGMPAEPDSGVNAFRNYEEASRYVILHDKVYTLQSPGAVTVGANTYPMLSQKTIRVNKKCSLDVDYSQSTAASTSEIIRGNIGVMAFLENESDRCGVDMLGTVRVKYSDSWPFN